MKLAHNTLQVPCDVADLVVIESSDDLRRALAEDESLLVLGGCSNVVLPRRLDRHVGLMAMRGIETTTVGGEVLVTAQAGENWHALVRYVLGQGWTGLENLALIPGQVGAAPIQNIGAYGVELASITESVRVYDRHDDAVVDLAPQQCEFAYRSSVFKREPGRYVVLSLTLRVNGGSPVLDYPDVRTEIDRLGWRDPSARQVAEVIMRIRRRKLPDPRVCGNVGSFFKNPVVPRKTAERLARAHPGLVAHAHGEATKLAAAQLIDWCGWKAHRDGPVGVWARQPLVLVNLGGASGADFLQLGEAIRRSVEDRFQITLEMEPTVVDDGD